MSAAGDINGDGFGDLIVGADRVEDPGGGYVGQSYVVFGKAIGFAAEIEASDLSGADGFTISGTDGGDHLGTSVSAAGDVSGDGIDDLIVGAPNASSAGAPSAGQSYLVYGKTSAFPAALNVADLLPANGGDGSVGTVINGINANDTAGTSVSAAGDVNGDGFDDLVIGAYTANLSGAFSSEGQSYVVFGDDFSNAVTQRGDAGPNALDGSAAMDVLIGGAADDALVGNGGQDVLRGGEGDDVLAVSDTTFRRIVGGNGIDTLRVDGSGNTLNLNALPDSRILGIEVIDITGNSPNTLILGDLTGPQHVLKLSDESNTLTVLGDADDVVHLGGGWAAMGQQVIGPNTFNVFTHGLATVNVLDPVLTSIATFELSTLLAANGGDGSQGFTLNGVAVADLSGYSVSGAGDVYGDGFDDVIVGAPYADVSANTDAGRAYVVFGKAGPFAAEFELSSLLAGMGGDGSQGFVLNGVDPYDHAGTAVSTAGDVDGDGMDDVLISAPRASPNNNDYAGETYLVFGQSGFSAELDLGTLDGNNGYVINGTAMDDELGRADQTVSNAGDLNGDGVDDLMVSADVASPNATDMAGETHVLFGDEANLAALDALDGNSDGKIQLPNLNGTNGVSINGILMNDRAGYSISEAGDVNGDDIDDIVIGAFEADPNGLINSGAAYVIYGKTGGFSQPLNLSALTATDGFVISGANLDDLLGSSVGAAGDFNDDGFDDVVVSADSGGESYLVFGSTAPVDLNVAALNGTNGFVITGASQVSAAGDLNGDGLGDVLIGRGSAAPNGVPAAGRTVVLFGQRTAAPATLDVLSLNGANGFAINGIAMNDRSGDSVSGAGDLNMDGFDDLIIAARQRNNSAGQSYVLFGRDFTGTSGPAGAPVITEVLALGSSWTAGFLSGLQARGAGTGGFSIPVGSAAQLESLRWGNTDRIVIRFSENVAIAPGAIELTGVLGPDGVLNANVDYVLSITTRVGATGQFEAVLELAAPLNVDKLLLKVNAAAVTNGLGEALDGEWTDTVSTFASGDGTAGGDFRFRINSLPGDADGDGAVGDVDLSILLSAFGTGPPTPLTNPRSDMNGDLSVGDNDLSVLLANFGGTLPAGAPAAPEPAAPVEHEIAADQSVTQANATVDARTAGDATVARTNVTAASRRNRPRRGRAGNTLTASHAGWVLARAVEARVRASTRAAAHRPSHATDKTNDSLVDLLVTVEPQTALAASN